MIIEVWSSVGMTIKETLNSVDTAQLLSCIVYLHFLQKFLHHRIRAVSYIKSLKSTVKHLNHKSIKPCDPIHISCDIILASLF